MKVKVLCYFLTSILLIAVVRFKQQWKGEIVMKGGKTYLQPVSMLLEAILDVGGL